MRNSPSGDMVMPQISPKGGNKDYSFIHQQKRLDDELDKQRMTAYILETL